MLNRIPDSATVRLRKFKCVLNEGRTFLLFSGKKYAEIGVPIEWDGEILPQ